MKRALLISYHFPPSRAAGAVRWGTFAAAGREHGWEFDVICHVPDVATSRVDEPYRVSSEGTVRVFAAANRAHWILSAARRMSSFLRRTDRGRPVSRAATTSYAGIAPQVVSIGDLAPLMSSQGVRQATNVVLRHFMFVPWAGATTTLARELLRAGSYDAVISSGPPHLAAVAAQRAAATVGVPLVLDFRDPWSTMDVLDVHSASVVYPWIARHYERQCIDASSLVIANTERAAAALQTQYPQAHVVTLPNGYDGTPLPVRAPTQQFIAVFAGAIYLDRDPRPVFRALKACRDRLALTRENFVFRLIGECSEFGGVPLADIAAALGVGDLVETCPPLPRDRLYDELAAAALLVNLPQSARMCIPSKLYEYAQFPAWILSIEPYETATRDLLTPLGADVTLDDPSAIAAIIETRVRQFREGARAVPLARHRDFSFESLAKQLFHELDILPKA